MVYILLLFCFQPICVFDSKFLARLISEVIDIWASDMQMIPPLWQKVKKNWRALIKVKEESETVGFGNLIKKIKYTFILNWDLTKKIILVFVLKWIVLLNKMNILCPLSTGDPDPHLQAHACSLHISVWVTPSPPFQKLMFGVIRSYHGSQATAEGA